MLFKCNVFLWIWLLIWFGVLIIIWVLCFSELICGLIDILLYKVKILILWMLWVSLWIFFVICFVSLWVGYKISDWMWKCFIFNLVNIFKLNVVVLFDFVFVWVMIFLFCKIIGKFCVCIGVICV